MNVFTRGDAGRILDESILIINPAQWIERKNGLRWRTKLRYNWYHTIMNLPTLSTVAIACLVSSLRCSRLGGWVLLER